MFSHLSSVLLDAWPIGVAILAGTAWISHGATQGQFVWRFFWLLSMSLGPWVGGYRNGGSQALGVIYVSYPLILLMVAYRLGLLASWHRNGVGQLCLMPLGLFVPLLNPGERAQETVTPPRSPDPQPAYAQAQITVEQAIEQLTMDAARQLGVRVTAHPDVYALIARSLPAGADTTVANQLLDDAIRHPLLAARNSGATVVDFSVAADGCLSTRIVERNADAAQTPPIKLASRPISDREGS